MERRFSYPMIKLSLKAPSLTLEELPLAMPEFFEVMQLRTTDTVAVTVPGLEKVLRFDHKGKEAAEFPTLVEMSKNLARSAASTAGALITGQRVAVPPEVFEQRLQACHSCPHWNTEWQRCKLCGCKTNYKLRLAREQCPDPERPRWLAWAPEKS